MGSGSGGFLTRRHAAKTLCDPLTAALAIAAPFAGSAATLIFLGVLKVTPQLVDFEYIRSAFDSSRSRKIEYTTWMMLAGTSCVTKCFGVHPGQRFANQRLTSRPHHVEAQNGVPSPSVRTIILHVWPAGAASTKIQGLSMNFGASLRLTITVRTNLNGMVSFSRLFRSANVETNSELTDLSRLKAMPL